MAFTTVQHLRDAMSQAHVIEYVKTSGAPGAANRVYAQYRQNQFPIAPTGLPPAVAGVALTRSSPGAPPIPTLLAGKKWVLGRAEVYGQISTAGFVMLYDRLVHTGGLAGNTTPAQTVNSVALPSRAGTGEQVEAWVEVYTAIGGTSVTATVSYTNQAGTAGRTGTVAIGATSNAAGMAFGPVTLQAGDTGVRSVQTIQHATTGTAGNYGIVLRKRIADLTVFQAKWEPKDLDWIGLGLPPVDQDACIEMLTCNANSAAHSISGKLYLAEVDV